MLFNRVGWLNAKAGPQADLQLQVEALCLDLSARWPKWPDMINLDELAASDLLKAIIEKARELPEELQPDLDNPLDVLAWSVLIASEAGQRTLN